MAHGYATAEEEWHDFLMGTHPHLQDKSPLRLIPSSPRCRLCSAPFAGLGGMVLRRSGYAPWDKNPKICGRCFKGLQTQARRCPGTEDNHQVGGAEVELSMLFADVRGSSRLARQMPIREFTKLMNRFYTVSSQALVDGDAIIEKFVGDEVVGLFLPFMTGPDHARHAVATALELLRATGHGSPDGPWCPIGVGVNSGAAFVGIVSSGETADFTALGDPVNIAAHLASQASTGEVLIGVEAARRAAVTMDTAERRSLSLKGHRVEAVALSAANSGLDVAPGG